MTTELASVLLLVACIGATYAQRAIGALGAGRLREDSALFRWIGCVAFAITTGIMAKLVLSPSGTLAEAPLSARLLGISVGLAVFFASGRQRIFLSLGCGVLTFWSAAKVLPIL